MTAPSSPLPDIVHSSVETPVPDDAILVVALQPPEPASARQRAAWDRHLEVVSDAPLSSQETPIATAVKRPRTSGIDDDQSTQPESADEASSGLPSPVSSSPDLHTPMDSPPTSRTLSVDKDDVPDIRHLFINHRAPRPSLAGPSFGTGDVTGVSAGPIASDELRPMASQMYQLVMASLDSEGNYSVNNRVNHKFYIDTGSDDTFGFGELLYEIREPDDDGNMDLEVRTPWTERDRVHAPTHTWISGTRDFDPRLTNRELRSRGLTIGRIHYSDNALAHLGLLPKRTWALSCYDVKRQEQCEIYFACQFGVAFAINKTIHNDDTSGMLGLGLSGIQHADQHYSTDAPKPQSFLKVLQRKLKPVPPQRPAEEIAIFFCLRLAPECYPEGRPGRNPIQSWMSFNIWPCDMQPPWNTSKIVVDNRGARRHESRWTVRLRSIKFSCVEKASQRPDYEHGWLPQDSTLNFVDENHREGLLVHLDTGASVTHLPLAAVQRMNKNLFLNKSDIKRPEEGEDPETYEVDPRSWIVNLSPETPKIQVIYEFGGVEGSDPVIVYGPFETFAYQHNPFHPNRLEGLIVPSLSEDAGTLGLNFFQSMYISLHKSTDGLDFVRMAGQWPENFPADLENYYVSGVSSR